MSKRILLWDRRFPNNQPLRLTVDGAIASAAVRAGVAAAADPAEAGALSVGAPVDGGTPTIVTLQHGAGAQSVRRVVLPLAVAQVAASLGLGAGDFTGGAPAISLNTLTLSGSLQIGTATSGTISGATNGSTITANIPGITVDSGARTYSGTPSGSAATIANGLVETLAGATNSPKSSAVTVVDVALAIPAYYNGLADEFEDSTTTLVGRSNWTFPEWDAVPGSVNDPKWWQTDSVSGVGGFLHMNATFKTVTAPLYFGAAAAFGADVTAAWGYDRSGVKADGSINASYADSYQKFRVWQTDANNYLDVTIDNTGHRVLIAGKAGGTAITTQAFTGYNAIATTFLTRGEILVQIKNSKMRVRLDGQWLRNSFGGAVFPYDEVDLTTLVTDPTKRGGAIGIFGTTYTHAMAQYVRAKSLDLSIDFIDQFVGRDSLSATGGTAGLEFTYTGTPSQWVGRVLDMTTRAVVQDWALLKNVTLPSAGQAKAEIFLPMGGPYLVEAGYIGSDALLHATYSKPTMSGYRIATYGQSNSNNRAGTAIALTAAIQAAAVVFSTNGYSSVTPSPTLAVTGGSTKPQYREWAASYTHYKPGSSYETAKVLSSILGKPVGIEVLGADATGISALAPVVSGAENAQWTDFLNGVAMRRGIIEAVIWDQGEADADQTVLHPNTYYANTFLTRLLPGLRTAAKNPNLPVLISMVGRYALAGTAGPSAIPYATNDAYREELRQQYLAIVAADPYVFLSSSKLGMVHLDSYHYTGAAYTEISRRDAWSLAKYVFGQSVHDGRGPIFGSATLDGTRTTITLHVSDMNGATSLSGPTSVATGAVATAPLSGGLYGYQVSINGFTSLLPISTIAVSGNDLVITLSAAAPAGTVQVRSMYGSSYDDTALFYGVYSDLAGTDSANIPAFPIVTPITAA